MEASSKADPGGGNQAGQLLPDAPEAGGPTGARGGSFGGLPGEKSVLLQGDSIGDD